MSKYIDAEKEFCEDCEYRNKCEDVTFCDIKYMPDVEVAPVEYGEWLWDTEDKYWCSACGVVTSVDEYMGNPAYDYCPNCGARMKEPGGND